MIKQPLALCSVGLLIGTLATASASASTGQTNTIPVLLSSEKESTEDWKGEPYGHQMEVGGLTGMGVFDGSVGVSMLVNGAISIDEDGFIDDVSEQLFLEGYLGPVLFEEGAAFDYGLHARWDFNKDRNWSYFATGGLAGTITGESLGDAWRLYPRFSVGVLRNVSSNVRLRAELSHDLMVLGASYRF